jgi:L-2-hydroxyglutarate oxidase
LILEKEREVATHQSGHNSGVVHSGLYYRPGSLKARLCAEGRAAIHRICATEDIALVQSGKLVVATHPSQLPALDELERRGIANGLERMTRLGPGGITDIEPNATGIAGLHVPETSVVDFPGLAKYLATDLTRLGAMIATENTVTAIEHIPGGVVVATGTTRYTARVLINCAGLHSDRIANLAGVGTTTRIVPFRGEYYRMRDASADLVKALIYPVPDPRFPFLGVHFTRRIDGAVEVGPNAVLALGREHYRGTKRDWSDVRSLLSDRRFIKLASSHWMWGTREMIESRSKQLYARQARKLLPALRSSDLERGGSGVRAQAVGSDGSLIDDFIIETIGTTVHILNAPSPGATASLAIGRYIVDTADLPFS